MPTSVIWNLKVAADAPAVHADATQLHQIIMNLATNAWQALPHGRGHITLTVDRLEEHEQSFARIIVTDDGIGMSPELSARVFEPFFTTKPIGSGTGLGLAVVFGIVEDHGGSITFNSKLGGGTCVEIRLPVCDTPATHTTDAAIMNGHGQHILLVDDEPMLVDLGAEQLRRLGYQPTGVCNPQDAVLLVQDNPKRWSLVLSDLTMPSMSGIELACAIHAIRADLPVIISSGYGSLIDDHQLADANIVAMLDKPVEVAILAQTLHHLLQHDRTDP
jgi:CheY-like chemotaxis protein